MALGVPWPSSRHLLHKWRSEAQEQKHGSQKEKHNSGVRDQKNGDGSKDPAVDLTGGTFGPAGTVMQLDQTQVAHVRFPDGVEDVTQNRKCADEALDRNVQKKAKKGSLAQTKAGCFVNDIQREGGAQNISEPWKQPNDRID